MIPHSPAASSDSPSSSAAVTLIVPVFNEEENLEALAQEIYAAMSEQPRTWELLFVDDASTDNSLGVLQSLAAASPWTDYLSFRENRGQSAALAAGFAHARGEIFVTLDADLQNDPADIPPMLNLYDQGYDMVAGWRARRQDNLVKRLCSRIANTIRNRLSRESVKDTGCSLKVMRAAMCRQLPVFRGMHRFLPTLMKMRDGTVAEMRVNHRPRKSGISKYGVWDRAFSGLYDLLAVRWMQDRLIRYQIKEQGKPPPTE